MSLLSTKGIYGLMAIFEIAKGDRKNPVSLKDISNSTGVSKSYLEQVLNALRGAGLVSSVKGLKGGYFLQKTLDEVSFYDVFCLLEKDFCLTNVEAAQTGSYSIFFKEYEGKLKELFSMPLSSFEGYKDKAKQYLNYVI